MSRTHSLFSLSKLNVLLTIGFVLILFAPELAVGQGSTPARGFQAGGSYSLSDFESINTSNGNLMLNLALGKLAAGRGGLSGQLTLRYDSKLFDSRTQYYEDWEHPIGGNPQTVTRNMLVTSEQGGWHYGTGYELQLIDRMSQYPLQIAPQYPATETIQHYKVKVAFPDGSVREFLPRGFVSQMDEGYYDIRPDGYQTRFTGGIVQDVPHLTGTLSYYSFDGSFIRLDVEHDSDAVWGNNPWTLYFPDGTKVTNFGKRVTDRNGNYVEWSNVTYNGHLATQLMDNLGRKLIVEYQGVSDGEVIHVPGVGGVDLTYQVHWKAVQIFKTYSTTEPTHGSASGHPEILGQQFVVSRIDLPSQTGGLQYVFGYNAADAGSVPCCTPSYGWGELSSITLPSGAQAQYQYELDGENGPGFAYTFSEVLQNSITRKSLTYQQEYDGTSTPVTETTNYAIAINMSTITHADGGVVTQFGQPNFLTQNADGSVSEKIWQANRPQGFPQTSLYDPVTGVDAYDPQRVNQIVKTEFTSIRDANGTLSKTVIKDYTYDKNGNVTTIKEYDWVDYGSVPRNSSNFPTGIPSGAVLKRVTTNSYAAATPDASDTSSNDGDSYWNSSSPALKNVIAATEVSNGSATLTRAEFFYDNPVTTGNLTQQKRWDSTKGAYSNPLTGSNSISTTAQYNQYGSPTLTTDARNIQTRLVYGSVSGFTDLYPTQVQTAYQTAVQRTETREYDFSTGLVTRVRDVDNDVATATSYDVFGRPTLVKAAETETEETRTATEYSDVNRRVIVRSDLTNSGDGKLVTIQHYDQLGRVRLTRQLEDASNPNSAYDETVGIKVQTRYQVSNPCQPTSAPACLAGNNSVLGSYQLVSNPYRANTSHAASSETSMGWSRTRNDKAGRTIGVETFSGSGLPAPWGSNSSSTGVVVSVFDTNATTATDQAGKVRRSLTDGLGRLARIDEPDVNGALGSLTSPNQPTTYTYDALDNLTTVVQGVQQRTFVYDSLKRLVEATNPESETVNYRYDDNSNLLVKTDARTDPSDTNKRVSTHFEYDLLNRLTRRWYNGSSSVSETTHNSPSLPTGVGATAEAKFYYDNQSLPSGAPTFTRGVSIGRLVAQTYGSGSNGDYFSYDHLGRQTQKIQQTGTVNYRVSQQYNRAGSVSSMTYPSDSTTTNTFDLAGRLTAFSGNLGDGSLGTPRTYSTGIVYSSTGSMLKEQFGTNTPVYHKLHYNSRAQLCDVRASNVNDEWGGELGALVNYYSTNWAHCGSGADNNGNLLMSQTIINSVYFEDRYSYDSLNRLTGVSEYQNGSTLTGTQQYDYDRWGNRTVKSVSTLGTNKQFTVSAKNQLGVPSSQTGVMTYDKAGNLTTDTYTGAGNRTYDAENKITSAVDNNNQTATYVYDVSGNRIKRTANGIETWQVYGIGGELLAEYPANGTQTSPQKEYGYRNEQLLITAEPPPSPTATNVALATNGATVSSSSTLSPYYASHVIDGSRRAISWTVWLDGTFNSFPDWLEVSFNGSKTISEIDVITQQDNPSNLVEPTLTTTFSFYGVTAFEVQYWTGSAWATVPNVSVTGNNKVWRQFTFSPITTTKIRVLVNGGADNAYSRMVEVEAWGQSSPAPTSKVQWLVPDHLSTPRMIIDQAGTLANVKRHDYLPFGEELPAGIGGRTGPLGYDNSDGVRQRFTSKDRDVETGLDFFEARYYLSSQGRFTSPDPLMASGKPSIPQSWNRYTYCLNSPLILVDPSGMMWVYHYLDKNKTKMGIAWIDGDKIPKGLAAEGYKALDFGGAKSRDITLTNGSVVRLSADSGNPLQLRQAATSDGGSAYVNNGLVQELRRQTAPIPQATGLFIFGSIAGGYGIGTTAAVTIVNATGYGLVAAYNVSKLEDAEDHEVLAAAGTIQNAASQGNRFGPNQQALIDLAKEAKRGSGITRAEALTLINWANEYGVKPARGPEAHPGRPFGSKPHIHVGPVNHIRVK